jgi:GT2 family glycosyltransferase
MKGQNESLLGEFGVCRQLIHRFRQLVAPLKLRKLWPLHVGILICNLVLKHGRRVFKECFKYLYLRLEKEKIKIVSLEDWTLALQTKGTEKIVRKRIQEDLLLFTKKPLVSCLLPVGCANRSYLQESIDSVLSQYYPCFELVIASYGSLDLQIKALLEEYSRGYSQVKLTFCENASQPSNALQSAMQLAEGEYVFVLNQHDCLSRDALYEMVRKLHLHPEADLIYSDENTIAHHGLFINPLYKPDWCPDSFLSRNYMRHLTMIRKSMILRAGGFRADFAKSYEYDLFLRVVELTDHIVHVPKILYHNRVEPDSSEEDMRALIDAMERRKANALVERNPHCMSSYTIRYQPNPSSKVSIIIPTKDQTTIIKKCIDSIYSKTKYANFEIIVISNNSIDPDLFILLEKYKKNHGNSFRFYVRDIPFNYSQLMNEAVLLAKGDYLLFLNNDVEVISADWISEMTGQAERASIGAVGCKLLYFDDTIQHAGMILGQKNYLAVHTFIGEKRNGPSYFSCLDTINNYSAVTAACMMCRKTVFNEVNGFDEELKVDCNDVDFCLKLKAQGYHNIYLPHVELYHHESLTRGRLILNQHATEQFLKAQKIIRARWPQYLEHDPCYSIHLSERGDFRT